MISICQEINNQMMQLQAARNGALMLFLRQQNLSGSWRIADNGKEIVRADQAEVNRAG